jgi:hypothetical protein
MAALLAERRVPLPVIEASAPSPAVPAAVEPEPKPSNVVQPMWGAFTGTRQVGPGTREARVGVDIPRGQW